MVRGLQRLSECECGSPKPTWQEHCEPCRQIRFEASRRIELTSLPLSDQKRKVMFDGTLYAISAKGDESSLVKFGFTGKGILTRLRQLNNLSPVQLDTIAHCDAKRLHERFVLQYCRPERAKGEWHHRGERTMRAIELIRSGDVFALEVAMRRRVRPSTYVDKPPN